MRYVGIIGEACRPSLRLRITSDPFELRRPLPPQLPAWLGASRGTPSAPPAKPLLLLRRLFGRLGYHILAIWQRPAYDGSGSAASGPSGCGFCRHQLELRICMK